VAVKVVSKGQCSHKTILWEVHVLRNLSGHAHIVKLVDVIDCVDSCYMIMERIEGPCLSNFICEQPAGVLSVQIARKVFCQLLAALRHAHSAGFVHCDVKPENVRLRQWAPPGDVQAVHAVLLDWGFARRIGVQSEPITRGTPAYAAPEQLCGYQADGVSARACLSPTVDVWSLGATLCEMVVGVPPFGGRDFEQLVQNVLCLNLVAAARTLTGAPREVLDATLQIHPSDRATIEELCNLPWVVVSGWLPPRSDAFQLQCDACDDGANGAKGKLQWLCGGLMGASASASAWRGRLMGVAYMLLCVGALLWSQGGAAAEHQLVLHEEGDQ